MQRRCLMYAQWLAWSFVVVMSMWPNASPAQTAVEKPNYAGNWRVTIAGQALSAGELTFVLRPRSEPEVSFTVAIAKDRLPDGITRDVRAALRRQLDRHAYSIELQGKDSFVFTAEMGTPRFELSLLANSVDGVGVSISRE